MPVRDVMAVEPWYPRDWLSSEARAVLTPAGRSAYRDLLDAAWLAGGRLRDDDRVMQGLSGLSPGEWTAVREDVLRYFPVSEPGWRANPRQVAEYAKADGYRESCRAGGRAAAAKRWGGDSQAIAEQPPPYRTPTPTPSPTPTRREEETPSESPSPAAPKRKTDPLILDLKNRLGSGSKVCGDQIRALRGAGWDDARIAQAISDFAEPGMAPWEWTKKARGVVAPVNGFKTMSDRADDIVRSILGGGA